VNGFNRRNSIVDDQTIPVWYIRVLMSISLYLRGDDIEETPIPPAIRHGQ
jgi:hypothetical protein